MVRRRRRRRGGGRRRSKREKKDCDVEQGKCEMMHAKQRYKKKKEDKKEGKKKDWAFSKENIKIVHSKHWYIRSEVQTF
jgi:hypothetical protein